jgi:UDP-glucose 4-epimerase
VLKLLITGKSGFITNAVLSHLKDCDEIEATAVSVRGDEWKKLDFSRYDSILHTAGIAHVNPDPSLAGQYDEINHHLTVEIAKKAKAEGVGQFIFLSSIIVFGDAARAGVRRTITTKSSPAPSGAYGQSKLDAENALRGMSCDSFRAAIIRPPMVYGRGCKGNYNTLAALARKLPVFPEFYNNRSMLYVENLAELIRLIVLRRDCGTFHPQDAVPRSVTEIVHEICHVHGKKMRFWRILALPVRILGFGGLVRRAFGDMAYSRTISRYPENYQIVSFQEAIRRTEGDSKWQA